LKIFVNDIKLNWITQSESNLTIEVVSVAYALARGFALGLLLAAAVRLLDRSCKFNVFIGLKFSIVTTNAKNIAVNQTVLFRSAHIFDK
jgi:hypothetical protein